MNYCSHNQLLLTCTRVSCFSIAVSYLGVLCPPQSLQGVGGCKHGEAPDRVCPELGLQEGLAESAGHAGLVRSGASSRPPPGVPCPATG